MYKHEFFSDSEQKSVWSLSVTSIYVRNVKSTEVGKQAAFIYLNWIH